MSLWATSISRAELYEDSIYSNFIIDFYQDSAPRYTGGDVIFGIRQGTGYAQVGSEISLPSSAVPLPDVTVGGITYSTYGLLNISGTQTAIQASVLSDADSINEVLEVRIILARDASNQTDTISPNFGTVIRQIYDDEFSPPEPDIQVSRIDVPSQVEAGQAFNIGVELLNLGDQNLSSSQFRVEVFTSSSYSASSRIWGGDFTSGRLFSPQPDYNTISVPGSATTGINVSQLFVRVLADPNNAIDETNEGNNFRGVTIATTQPDLPDYVVTDLSIAGGDEIGDQMIVRYRTENQGTATAPVSYTQTVVRDAAGTVIFSDTNQVLSLQSGASRAGEESFTIPLSAADGNFTITVTANSTGLAESNSGNNDQSVLETIVAPNQPPLAVDDTFSPAFEADGTYFVSDAALLANDTDPEGTALSVSQWDLIRADANGTWARVAGGFEVTPNAGASVATMAYFVTDARGDGDWAQVDINIPADPNQNGAPVAGDDVFLPDDSAYQASGTYFISDSHLLSNDTDPDGDTIGITQWDLNRSDANGAWTRVSGGFEVTPAAGAATSTLAYFVSDPSGVGDWARVTFSVPDEPGPDNIAPFLNVLSQITLSPGSRVELTDLISAYDVDGEMYSVTVIDPSGGALLFNSDSSTYYNGVQWGILWGDVPGKFWVAPQTEGTHTLDVYVTDTGFERSATQTITMTVEAPAAGSAGSAPDITFAPDSFYNTGTDIQLTSLFSAWDPDGASDIESYVIADASDGTGRGNSGGYLYNSRTGERVLARDGAIAQEVIPTAEIGDWFFVTTPNAADGVDTLFVAPIDSDGLLPSGGTLQDGLPVDSMLTLNVVARPDLDLTPVGGDVSQTEDTVVALRDLVDINDSVTHIDINSPSSVVSFENRVTGETIADTGTILASALGDWDMVFNTVTGPRDAMSGQVEFVPHSAYQQGVAEQLNVETRAQVTMGTPETSWFEWLGDYIQNEMLPNGYATVKAYFQDLYDNHNIKYLLGFEYSGKLVVSGFNTGMVLDLADLFGVTTEGAGGYGNNTNGVVSLWGYNNLSVGVSFGSELGVSAGAAFTLTPVKFSPLSADIRSGFDISLPELSWGGSVAGFGVEYSYELMSDNISLDVETPILSLGIEEDNLEAYLDGTQPLTPSVKADVIPSFDTEVKLDMQLFGVDKITDLGEIDRSALLSWTPFDMFINTLPGVGALSLLWREFNSLTPRSMTDGMTGRATNDFIEGTSQGEFIEGLGGDDYLQGWGGDDAIFGGGGYDKIFGGGGIDTLNFGPDGGFLSGGSRSDQYLLNVGNLRNSETPNFTIFDDGLASDTDDAIYVYSDDPIAVGLDDIRFEAHGPDLHVIFSDTVVGGFIRVDRGTLVIENQASITDQIERIVLVANDPDDTQEIDLVLRAGLENWFGTAVPATDVQLIGIGAYTGSDAAEIFHGTDVADNLTAAGGDDFVFTGAGNDRIVAANGAGDDHYDGGTGIDEVVYTSSAEGIVVDLAEFRASGGPDVGTDQLFGIENVVGSLHDDLIAGDDKANGLMGQDGRDTILGLAGDDYLDGYWDDDSILGGSGDDTVLGNLGRDILSGSTGQDSLNGGLGADTIDGGSGDDTVNAGDSNDSVGGGDGDDLINGQSQQDTLHGGSGDDTLNGGAGGDQITGDQGDDSLNGGGGSDDLNGGSGDDTLLGLNQNDVLAGGSGRDRAEGGNGQDSLNGGAGNDTLVGGVGNDTANGGDGNDRILGSGGDDVLRGQNNQDTLIGGGGNDVLYGGPGGDNFVFADRFGQDTIVGFEAFNSEQIDLSDVTNIVDFGDLVANHLVNSGGEAMIVDGVHSILLEGVSFSDVGVGQLYSAGDFVF